MIRIFSSRRADIRRPLTAVAVVALLLPAAAQAGFEIRGAGIPQPPPVSGGALESDSTLAPIGMMPDAAGRPTIPVTAVPIDAPAPVDMAARDIPPDQVDGFGYDLPLVIALQQVAPPGYQFAFSDSVDPGTRVSWQGGRAWRDVVRDMLSPLGLVYEVRDGNVLSITPKGEAAVTPMQTAQVTPAAPVAPAPDTQQMRRQKPSGFLDRVKSRFDRGHDVTPVDQVSVPVAPSPPVAVSTLQPEERVIEPVPAPVPVAESLTAQEDLSPISLSPVTAAPSAAVPAPVVRPPTTEAVVSNAWQARQGDTLRNVLGGWSARAGVDMHWSIDYDYRLSRDIEINGGYADAVTQVLDQFQKAKPRPYARLHRSAGATQVLVVKAYGVNE